MWKQMDKVNYVVKNIRTVNPLHSDAFDWFMYIPKYVKFDPILDWFYQVECLIQTNFAYIAKFTIGMQWNNL